MSQYMKRMDVCYNLLNRNESYEQQIKGMRSISNFNMWNDLSSSVYLSESKRARTSY